MQALAGVTVLRCVWLRYLTLTVPIGGWTSVPSEEGGGGAKCTSSHFSRVSIISIGVHLLTFKSVNPWALSFSFELFGLSSNEISSPTRGSTAR